MLNIKSLSIATDGAYKRIAITYDEIDNVGKVINSNARVNRVVVDNNILDAIASIENFARLIVEE